MEEKVYISNRRTPQRSRTPNEVSSPTFTFTPQINSFFGNKTPKRYVSPYAQRQTPTPPPPSSTSQTPKPNRNRDTHKRLPEIAEKTEYRRMNKAEIADVLQQNTYEIAKIVEHERERREHERFILNKQYEEEINRLKLQWRKRETDLVDQQWRMQEQLASVELKAQTTKNPLVGLREHSRKSKRPEIPQMSYEYKTRSRRDLFTKTFEARNIGSSQEKRRSQTIDTGDQNSHDEIPEIPTMDAMLQTLEFSLPRSQQTSIQFELPKPPEPPQKRSQSTEMQIRKPPMHEAGVQASTKRRPVLGVARWQIPDKPCTKPVRVDVQIQTDPIEVEEEGRYVNRTRKFTEISRLSEDIEEEDQSQESPLQEQIVDKNSPLLDSRQTFSDSEMPQPVQSDEPSLHRRATICVTIPDKHPITLRPSTSPAKPSASPSPRPSATAAIKTSPSSAQILEPTSPPKTSDFANNLHAKLESIRSQAPRAHQITNQRDEATLIGEAQTVTEYVEGQKQRYRQVKNIIKEASGKRLPRAKIPTNNPNQDIVAHAKLLRRFQRATPSSFVKLIFKSAFQNTSLGYNSGAEDIQEGHEIYLIRGVDNGGNWLQGGYLDNTQLVITFPADIVVPEDVGIVCLAAGVILSNDTFEEQKEHKRRILRFRPLDIIVVTTRDVIVGWSEGYVANRSRKKIGIVPNSYLQPIEFAE